MLVVSVGQGVCHVPLGLHLSQPHNTRAIIEWYLRWIPSAHPPLRLRRMGGSTQVESRAWGFIVQKRKYT